jgi:hypothetical protein
MTHDGLRESDGGVVAMDAVERGRRDGRQVSRLPARGCPAATVAVADPPIAAVMVVPLWDRPRVGVCR